MGESTRNEDEPTDARRVGGRGKPYPRSDETGGRGVSEQPDSKKSVTDQ